MEPFVQVFFAIDKDGTEVISVDELKAYVAKNNLDTQMISKWQQLFDPDKTGKITFPKFCEVLGLSPAQAVAMKTQQQSASLKLHPDIIVIYEQLPLQKQVEISNKTLELLHSSPKKLDEKEQAIQLKEWLDKVYGKAWHVVIVKGSFWSSYSHSANKCFMYRTGEYSYLVWRTPDEEITADK